MRHPFKRDRTASAIVAAFLLCVLGLVAPQTASAAPMGFTVMGTGGTSPALPPVSDSSFWWIDSTGGVSGSVVDPFGFDLFRAPGINGLPAGATGSLLLSSLFTLGDGETLDVSMDLMSAHSMDFGGLGFAVLLEDSTVKAVLASARPDGIQHFGDLAHPTDVDFTGASAGVAYSANSGAIPQTFQLGSVTYGVPEIFSCQHNTCQTSILASIAPGAGTYQLLFGSFSIDGGRSALAVTDVSTSVPEPATIALLGLPVAFLLARRRSAATGR